MIFRDMIPSPSGAPPFHGSLTSFQEFSMQRTRPFISTQYPLTASFATLVVILVLATCTSASAQQERVLYPFTGGADGSTPFAGVIPDASGNLYGATFTNGTSGSAYKLSPPAVLGQPWTETTLYTFGATGDAAGTVSVMTLDSAGNLYGATAAGGANGLGAVFQLAPPATQGGAWTENLLY